MCGRVSLRVHHHHHHQSFIINHKIYHIYYYIYPTIIIIKKTISLPYLSVTFFLLRTTNVSFYHIHTHTHTKKTTATRPVLFTRYNNNNNQLKKPTRLTHILVVNSRFMLSFPVRRKKKVSTTTTTTTKQKITYLGNVFNVSPLQ
jgi:hypothetical protein